MTISINLTKNFIKEEMKKLYEEMKKIKTDGSDDLYYRTISVQFSTYSGVLSFIKGQEDAVNNAI